jgi:hypothetical protein
MTNDDETQPALPGLELDPELGGARGALRNAVVLTLDALKADGLLEARHTAVAQLALTLADAVARGTRSGRASAAAMAAAQLLATLDALPKPIAADQLERFNRLVDALEADVNGKPSDRELT